MTKILAIVMAIFMMQFMYGGRIAGAQTADLSQYRWKNRLLLIFAPDRSHTMFKALHQSILAQEAEISDRDLVIFEIIESGPSRLNKAILASETAHLFREKFSADTGKFRIILIGKDGGVKLNRGDRTDLQDIFALIDSMPMRQEEIRQKSQ